MKRREFLLAAALAGGVGQVPGFDRPAVAGTITQRRRQGATPKIKDVQILQLQGRRDAQPNANRQPQVKPLYIYPEHRPQPYRQGDPGKSTTINTTALYIVIQTDIGIEGLYGPVDREAAVVVDRQIRRFLIGKNPLAGEAVWDKLYRLNRHSRASHFMMAISAVDNALWDLRGRYFDAPVYQLLGGPTREKVQVYGSCLGYSVEPEHAKATSAEFKKMGFDHQKWFLAYGPGAGTEGLEKNVELVKNLRSAVGDDVELMFDAFMGWDLQYAVAWAKQVEKYRPRWIEEAFAPNRIESFARLRNSTSIPVATGEHFYGRWEVNDFLKAGAISVIQADPEWCGGVSELVKICTLASVHDVHVVPHGHSLHAALHVVASQSPATCPLVEYLFKKMGHYYHFEKHPLRPVNGMIQLPDRPGFGIELDDSKIEKREQLHWS